MRKIPFIPLIVWYLLLALVMVTAKFLEGVGSEATASALVANVLGLILLMPWILMFPGGHLGQGINTPIFFLCFSLLNLGLPVMASFITYRVNAKLNRANSSKATLKTPLMTSADTALADKLQSKATVSSS